MGWTSSSAASSSASASGETATREGIQIGFKVETAAEVDAWAQELGRRGFALAAPPSGDRWEGSRSFRLADPDGRQVAIFFDYLRPDGYWRDAGTNGLGCNRHLAVTMGDACSLARALPRGLTRRLRQLPPPFGSCCSPPDWRRAP